MRTGSPARQAVTTWSTSWSDALAALELDLDRAESLLAANRSPAALDDLPRTPWVPPLPLGPLPGGLRARAEAILARQLRVADQLARAVAAGRRELQLAQLMGSAAADRRPAFLDASF